MRTEWALMVIPLSRSRSMASSTCACISRAVSEPVSSSRRSERVLLPWSMWAMIAKLRITEWSIDTLILTGKRAGCGASPAGCEGARERVRFFHDHPAHGCRGFWKNDRRGGGARGATRGGLAVGGGLFHTE